MRDCATAPLVTVAPPELVAFVQRALGGKKWRKQAAEYALALANQRVASVDKVGELGRAAWALERNRDVNPIGEHSATHAALRAARIFLHPPGL